MNSLRELTDLPQVAGGRGWQPLPLRLKLLKISLVNLWGRRGSVEQPVLELAWLTNKLFLSSQNGKEEAKTHDIEVRYCPDYTCGRVFRTFVKQN